MGISLIQIDAFTDQPFRGNPAAVCMLPGPSADGWMQSIAREMNLSETAFVHPQSDGFGLRWFTPAMEVELCGHATLAASHALWEEGHLQPGQQARFHTGSGPLTASRRGAWIYMDFPAEPAEPADEPPELAGAFGVAHRFVGMNRLDYLVEVDGEERLRTLVPDLRALAKLEARGVIVTSLARSADYDFVSRYFAPSCGIDEDPVTGSAHCCLGPFWQ